MTGLEGAKQITAHFLVHWGVPKDFHLRRPLSPTANLAIMEFGVRGERSTCRFATNGMSGVPQGDGEGIRTELYAGSVGSHPWIIELLDALARYPMQHQTTLAEFDTISVGPIDRKQSPFAAVLLAPPGPEESETMGAIGADYRHPVLVHQVIGIFERECDFAIEEGGEELWRRLSKQRPVLLLDAERASVA